MILQEKLRPYRLLLASHSPRRQQLLRDCGLDYTLIDRYEVEERYPAGLPPHDVPLFLSQLKSDAYPEPLAANDILLTADTVVVAAGGILGKPHDRDEAVGNGIQEWIGYVAIESINGSFYNVMGLPVQRLYVELDRFLSQQAG